MVGANERIRGKEGSNHRRAFALLLAIPLVVLLLVWGFSSWRSTRSPAPPGLPRGVLVIRGPAANAVLSVEIAETDAARQRGLMGRRRLARDSGMVFLFDRATTSSFWMKNTLIPLSVAFWGRNGRIVAILDMDPCRADPCPHYSPGVPYVGAVEVNQGFFREARVRVGDAVRLVRP